MDSFDNYIVNWFNGGFGVSGASEQLKFWGNLALIVLSLILSALFSGVIGFEREYHERSRQGRQTCPLAWP